MTGNSGFYENTRGARIARGETTDYKERMKDEYHQLKNRYEKLHKMCIKYEAGTLDFTPDCPLELLKEQKSAMGNYLRCLEVRAEIEHIEL
jgi:hypothetical protein